MGRTPKRIGIVVAALATAGAMAVVPSTAQAERSQDAAAPQLLDLGAAASTSGRNVVAARHADVDTALLQPGVARTVSIDVVDTDLRVDLQPIESGAQGWSAWNGAIAGSPDSSATVVRRGDDVAAMISTPSGSYRVRTTAPGQQVVQQIAGTFPEALGDAVTPSATLDLGIDPDAVGGADGTPSVEGDVPTNPVVDVLVAYTQGALSLAGSQSAMNTEIALSISATNTAYADSGVVGRVRLVGQTALSEDIVLDDENGLGLSEVTSPNDGHSDQIHALRNAAGADLVSVLVDDSSSCGLAWSLNGTTAPAERSRFGFSVVHLTCAVDNYSFPHELGHNMGLSHDEYVDGAPDLFPYAQGYVNTTDRWRTIMAYNNKCADLGFNCARLGRFSNPDQTYLGAPLGRPSTGSSPADSRKALNTTHAFVASWRAKPTPFTTWTRFVTQQFKDFVGRTPSSGEATSAVNLLTTGGTTPQAYIDGQLKGSFGASYAPVTRLYFAYFVRSPDPGGLDYWVRKYQGGMKLTAISSNFAASSEFKNKYGTLSNRAFVNKIYVNLFERTGDASGVNYWTGKLDARTKTRGEVMVNFSESSEFKRVRAEEIDVVLLHRSMLQRSATPSEFADKVGRLQGGTKVQRLILEVLDSAEYGGRVTK